LIIARVATSQKVGDDRLPDSNSAVTRDVTVVNKEGLHARPVMRFVDVATGFDAEIVVSNVSGRAERVDGKSAMEMMLLEAIQGNVLRIEGTGPDAASAVNALVSLVESGFQSE
jgi:PTS hybrid protein